MLVKCGLSVQRNWRDLSLMNGEKEKGHSYFWKYFVSYTIKSTLTKKHALSKWPRNLTPRCLPTNKEVGIYVYYMYIKSYMHLYIGFIRHCQNFETTPRSFNEWINNQTIVYLFNRRLLKNRNELTTKTYDNRNESQCIWHSEEEHL